MKGGLVQRFVHGNFAVTSLMDSEADLHLGVPARQRQLVSLVRSQAAVGERTLKALRTHSEVLRSVLQNEIGRHSASLENAVQQGARVVAAAIDDLGRMLSAELVGIRWELHQIRKTEDQILEVLKRPRRTEAKELLQQGIQNLVNDRIEEAEDRFLRAKQLDNTDYQVFMNLSAVELHKGNADAAKRYVEAALDLPADLDQEARCEGLWWLARLHYVNGDYQDAVSNAEHSLQIRSDARRTFQYGCYLALAGNGEEGFAEVRRAIESDPEVFALAAMSEDLAQFPQELESLLSSLSEPALATVKRLHDQLTRELPPLSDLPGIPASLAERPVDSLRAILDHPTYRSAVEMGQRADELAALPQAFHEYSERWLEAVAAKRESDRSYAPIRRWRSKVRRLQWSDIGLDEVFAGLVLLAMWGLVGYLFLSTWMDGDIPARVYLFAVAILIAPLAIFLVSRGRFEFRKSSLHEHEGRHEAAASAWMGARNRKEAALRRIYQCLGNENAGDTDGASENASAA